MPSPLFCHREATQIPRKHLRPGEPLACVLVCFQYNLWCFPSLVLNWTGKYNMKNLYQFGVKTLLYLPEHTSYRLFVPFPDSSLLATGANSALTPPVGSAYSISIISNLCLITSNIIISIKRITNIFLRGFSYGLTVHLSAPSGSSSIYTPARPPNIRNIPPKKVNDK